MCMSYLHAHIYTHTFIYTSINLSHIFRQVYFKKTLQLTNTVISQQGIRLVYPHFTDEKSGLGVLSNLPSC